ncbi:MAG: hypothetical protein NTY83_02630, partial [Candidatus Micrarchaeota archaeon]|nr:hypothetical protein [Candidatus Micrarchaeota archaeon]
YFPVYGALVTVFGKALALDPMQAMFIFSAFVPLLSMLAFFFLGKEVFGDEKVAALLALLLFPGAITMKYTEFTTFVVFPLFLGMLFRFSKKPGMGNGALLGLLYGVVCLSHGSGFPVGTALMGAVFAYMGWKANWKMGKKELIPYGLAAVIGIAIAMLYWFAPIFVYHGSTLLKSEIWSFPNDLHEFGQAVGKAVELLVMFFLNFGSINTAMRSVLVLAGLYLVWKGKLWEENGVLAVSILAVLAITFSFVMTAPLLDIQFMPDYIASVYGYTAVVLIGGFALQEVLKRWGVAFYVIAALLLLSAYTNYQSISQGQYYVSGKEALPAEITDIYAGIKANTGVHDRILSTNENSFAINAMTGRELLVSRRAHNEPFVDFDKRELAAAVILYGNDLEEKRRLIEEYEVDYIYADYHWMDSEFYFNANGQMTGWFDPLLVMDTPENRVYLDINGVKYTPMTTWIDPSVKGANVRLYDLLIVGPENYEMTGYGPWKNDLDSILTLEWEYDYAGQPIAALYKINAG